MKLSSGHQVALFNVRRIPFRLAAHVEHLHRHRLQLRLSARPRVICAIVATGSPACFHAATPPARYPSSASMPTRASRDRASSICCVCIGNQHRMRRQSQHRSGPRRKLSRQRDVHRSRHVTGGKLIARYARRARVSPSLNIASIQAARIARSGGNSDKAAAPVRLISASFRKYSGRAGRLLVSCAMNSSLLLICSA